MLKNKTISNGDRGFALLIAIVVATIILTIGISIVNVALKEVILASTVRNSLASFYTADSGVECALYWDNIRGNFSKESVFDPKQGGAGPSTIECGGILVGDIFRSPTVNFGLVSTSNADLPCGQVNVEVAPVGKGEDKVTLKSLGSNTCNTNNSRRVERALEVKYSRFE
ncbi:MAG: hypothetical protein A2749_01140 [Parcubacteria group bacterium RIFCSPHIGHO2_01_FULL_45_26]|nr:MAG: hypothetical protein A2749_01140 [Parcubacteria group bacterium RIFCSPHIGHO2_01_FULL_45_26]